MAAAVRDDGWNSMPVKTSRLEIEYPEASHIFSQQTIVPDCRRPPVMTSAVKRRYGFLLEKSSFANESKACFLLTKSASGWYPRISTSGSPVCLEIPSSDTSNEASWAAGRCSWKF